MWSEASSGRIAAVAPRPLAELLDCPAPVSSQLNRAARSLDLQSGEVAFHQFETCRGLYLAVTGQLQRRALRLDTRVTLGPVRTGELVELAAALSHGLHSYTLSALGDASLLMLPIEALDRAFQSYPGLRMQLLEELAREVSRAYAVCTQFHPLRLRNSRSVEKP
jgi:CRP-like cAMP-binding protein